MSDINGTGYGSKHDWQRGYTSPDRLTRYKCTSCGEKFNHAYDKIPDIFDAMKSTGVPEHCQVTKEEV